MENFQKYRPVASIDVNGKRLNFFARTSNEASAFILESSRLFFDSRQLRRIASRVSIYETQSGKRNRSSIL